MTTLAPVPPPVPQAGAPTAPQQADPAAGAAAPALAIGPHVVQPPVVLAPMAGITNAPFRTLCREFAEGVRGFGDRADRADRAPATSTDAVGAAGTFSKGLFVSEMITTRALVERNEKTMQLIHFDAGETPRSIQLYGVDPVTVGKAVRMIVDEGLADHIDLNFGCPVPKVTRKGGGSALPYKRPLLRAILHEAVSNAGALPVTMKMRKGIDDDHLTYLDAGRIAVDEGVTAIALHGRTAAQHYGGTADWEAIARLKEHVPEIPVLGNGDIWSAGDALRMMRETGCDGVVVGRGCLGRPWLFSDLVAAFEGGGEGEGEGGGAAAAPGLAEVAAVMRRHAELLGEWIGDETRGVIDFRKHVAWYLKGFSVGSEMRKRLAITSSLAELDEQLALLDLDQPWPLGADGPRGRTSGNNRVVLPDGWLKDPYDCSAVSADAELDTSGG
ncbi:tRNA dihydrouridine synthase DusB [Streptomyces yaizuensis]|uniref:tRNA dihydrouridine synthase DusB n=1 Tax=Streptomyces yaizuensis TaxID=2989713 RepID=A0ABQ5NTW3_9ACTN|nr:tRNA dihydrouridine synthase DusB [Streptomyces sp. YSPA8]GLF93808.1 tRNA dihydrouridine synthase DusB [Streptomyces sp. YSPA8]